MTKTAQKAMNFYNSMISNNRVYKTWVHEDYKDVMVYENINGNIVCIQRNDKGEIIDAWLE